MEPVADKQEAKVVGRYLLADRIGAGGMASVHLGRLLGPVGFSRTVAIKRLHAQFTDSAEFVSMFVDEARLAARIRHPNVVPTLDVVTADGELFQVMEYVQGESLARLLRVLAARAELIPLRIVSAIVCDVLHGLHAAHETKDEQGQPLKIVHRDVSPHNVLVGVDGTTRVFDFGIAKAVHRVQSTQGGQLKGKLAYMAPEQISQGQTERAADIYSASVVLWEALTGKRLFVADTQGELVKLILEGDLEPPSKVVAEDHPDMDPMARGAYEALDLLVEKGLSIEPEQRFATAREMATELESCIAPASRAEVGQWVERIAKDVLEDRARLVSDLESGGSGVSSEPEDLLQAIRSSPRSSGKIPNPSSLSDLNVGGVPRSRPALPRMPTSEPPPPAAPSSERLILQRMSIVGAVLVALALGGVWLARLRAQPPAGGTTATGQHLRMVTDWTPPPGVKTDAAAAYRAGLQAIRDGSFDLALQNFGKATAADPGLAGAHLRAAIADSMFGADVMATRQSYAKAVQFRASLGETDRVILSAFEPYMQREPSDPAESERRLIAAVAADPNDVELRVYLGLMQFWSGHLDAARATMGDASALDPLLATALAYQGAALAYLGHAGEARALLDRCIERSPFAIDCLFYRVQIEEQGGECAKEEADAKMWIARDPGDFYGYQMLAQALAGQSRPLDVVRLAYEQKWAKMYAQNRPAHEPLERARLDVLAGDFAAAEAHLRESERITGASDPGQTSHAEPAMMLADLYRETGRQDLARAVADEYVQQGDVLVTAPLADDGIISSDPLPRMYAVQWHSGELTREAFEARRKAWLEQWRKKTSGAYVGFLWIYAYADAAETREEATQALDALPPYAPLPVFAPQSVATGLVGQVYWLAGKLDVAIPRLRSAAASCVALMEPIGHTRMNLTLGQALEASGDREGACAAYEVVLQRWGKAKPSSISANRARERSVALGCKR
jgi:serine/threonine-protein kinase